MTELSPYVPLARDRMALRSIMPVRSAPDLADDVRRHLLQRPRSLPPKYFYDERGSNLFDRICDTPEYYVTRAEDALLARYAEEIIATVRPRILVELGAGTSRKTRHLLNACEALGCHSSYAPFDVCAEVLMESGEQLVRDYDWLNVEALVGDFLAGLDNLPDWCNGSLYLFLGGTLGNFSAAQAGSFLGEIRRLMGPDDYFLLGVDRVKDPALLHAAYNDAQGITAEFNHNALRVLNAELDADFDEAAFYHHAVYRPDTRQIEMYLQSGRDQSVHFGALNERSDFQEGESILTEISRKFTPDTISTLLASAGLSVRRHFEPDNGHFSLLLVQASDAL